MLPLNLLNKIAASLSTLPGVSEDVKKQVVSIVSGQLHKLDIVTQEEFEVQRAMLAKTQELVAALEQRVQELEGQSTSQD